MRSNEITNKNIVTERLPSETSSASHSSYDTIPYTPKIPDIIVVAESHTSFPTTDSYSEAFTTFSKTSNKDPIDFSTEQSITSSFFTTIAAISETNVETSTSAEYKDVQDEIKNATHSLITATELDSKNKTLTTESMNTDMATKGEINSSDFLTTSISTVSHSLKPFIRVLSLSSNIGNSNTNSGYSHKFDKLYECLKHTNY